jgi:hypothetical protein
VFKDTVTLRIGTSKFDKHIRSTAKYEDLLSTVKAATGLDGRLIASRDAQGRLLWIRTSQDVHFMFAAFFADNVPFLRITLLQPDELSALTKLPLRKEHQFKDGMAVFRVECAGEEAPSIYLTIPPNSTREEAIEHFQSLFGEITALSFEDPAQDRIDIDGQDPWEYCMETAVAMSKAGRFLLLHVEGTPPE